VSVRMPRPLSTLLFVKENQLSSFAMFFSGVHFLLEYLVNKKKNLILKHYSIRYRHSKTNKKTLNAHTNSTTSAWMEVVLARAMN
jgi:hypothetical protein